MLDFLSKAFGSLFGNKTERDIKTLMPKVELINKEYDKLKNLSHDQLRGKTNEFRDRIHAHLAETSGKIEGIRAEIAEHSDMDAETKEDLYRQIEGLQKEKNQEIENILNELLP